MEKGHELNLSGERFLVTYAIAGAEKEAYATARDICVEQTAEFPEELVPEGDIRNHILGQIQSFTAAGEKRFQAVISYAVETTAFELLQFLNVVYGNISMKTDIRVERFELPQSLLNAFKGPRFGIAGVRDLLNIPDRPLLCSAVKPMGLSVRELAGMAYEYALGGIDVIKDDHGLTNQPFSPFIERVQRCAEAVQRANQKTGEKCLYLPNVSAPVNQVLERAHYVKAQGGGGLMVLPALTGMDSMRMLAEDDSLGLPVMSHPAFLGSYTVAPQSGFSFYCMFGQIARLAGADMSVYPNFAGRFSATREDCIQAVAGTMEPMGHIKAIFPVPGGGLTFERVPELRQVYSRDVIFLMGGGLHRAGNLVKNCRSFREMVEKMYN